MRKYFAWVFFVLGIVNTTNLSYQYAIGGKLPPTVFEAVANPSLSNVFGAVWSFALLGIFALFFFLWWKWK